MGYGDEKFARELWNFMREIEQAKGGGLARNVNQGDV
jgi:hypothetical protein